MGDETHRAGKDRTNERTNECLLVFDRHFYVRRSAPEWLAKYRARGFGPFLRFYARGTKGPETKGWPEIKRHRGALANRCMSVVDPRYHRTSVMRRTVLVVLGDLLRLVALGLRSHRRLAAESLFLRKQLAFYRYAGSPSSSAEL